MQWLIEPKTDMQWRRLWPAESRDQPELLFLLFEFRSMLLDVLVMRLVLLSTSANSQTASLQHYLLWYCQLVTPYQNATSPRIDVQIWFKIRDRPTVGFS